MGRKGLSRIALKNEVDSTRIVLVNRHDKLGGDKGDFDKPYMLRSYDHFYRHNRQKRVGTNDDTQSHLLNVGSGTDLAAWKVARAATAATLFFKPLTIALDDGEVLRHRYERFSRLTSKTRKLKSVNGQRQSQSNSVGRRPTALLFDAGFGADNNPSEKVYYELKNIFDRRQKSLATWVSIGTARKIVKNGDKRTKTLIEEALNGMGDTERGHEFLQGKCKDTFDYFRLNEPGGLSVEMDEWKPKDSGSQTIQSIETSFNRWAGEPENGKTFRNCAKKLVQIRRARRADPSLWERYALGSFYTCTQNQCKYDCDETWNYLDTFTHHLRADHGIDDNVDGWYDLLDLSRWNWVYKPKPT